MPARPPPLLGVSAAPGTSGATVGWAADWAEGLHREQGRVYPAEQFQFTLLLQTGLLTCSKAMEFPFLQKPLAQQACECPQRPG